MWHKMFSFSDSPDSRCISGSHQHITHLHLSTSSSIQTPLYLSFLILFPVIPFQLLFCLLRLCWSAFPSSQLFCPDSVYSALSLPLGYSVHLCKFLKHLSISSYYNQPPSPVFLNIHFFFFLNYSLSSSCFLLHPIFLLFHPIPPFLPSFFFSPSLLLSFFIPSISFPPFSLKKRKKKKKKMLWLWWEKNIVTKEECAKLVEISDVFFHCHQFQLVF